MTEEHHQHLNSILSRVNHRMTDKYIRGQNEHLGSLWLKENLVDDAIDEAIDQLVYLYTLKDQLERNKADDIPTDLSK